MSICWRNFDESMLVMDKWIRKFPKIFFGVCPNIFEPDTRQRLEQFYNWCPLHRLLIESNAPSVSTRNLPIVHLKIIGSRRTKFYYCRAYCWRYFSHFMSFHRNKIIWNVKNTFNRMPYSNRISFVDCQLFFNGLYLRYFGMLLIE